MKYQPLDFYDGTLSGVPSHEGIEYDYEVPDEYVVESPGGVSSIQHHYTKGFYGNGNISTDKFAGQGETYDSGVYGSLYETGQTASQEMGLYPQSQDQTYWANQAPNTFDYSQSIADAPYPGVAEGDASQSKIENYSSVEGGTPTEISLDDKSRDKTFTFSVKKTLSPTLLFFLFLFAFIAFSFWAEAGNLFINQSFHSKIPLTWQRMLVYAILITILFGLSVWMAGVPISTFEDI